jgi:hypothetical protein
MITVGRYATWAFMITTGWYTALVVVVTVRNTKPGLHANNRKLNDLAVVITSYTQLVFMIT